jgi:hypothetical protein
LDGSINAMQYVVACGCTLDLYFIAGLVTAKCRFQLPPLACTFRLLLVLTFACPVDGFITAITGLVQNAGTAQFLLSCFDS